MIKTIICALAATVVAPALAQPPSPAASASGPKSVTRSNFVAQLNSAFSADDTNHDGYLSSAEIQAAQGREVARLQAVAHAKLEAEFRQLDTNHDGQLSLQEFEAIAAVHRASPHSRSCNNSIPTTRRQDQPAGVPGTPPAAVRQGGPQSRWSLLLTAEAAGCLQEVDGPSLGAPPARDSRTILPWGAAQGS